MVLALCLLCASACTLDRRAWKVADAWYAPPEHDADHSTELARDLFQLVPEQHVAEASSRLSSEAIVEVSRSEAERIVGREVIPVAGRKLFLVRGLDLGGSLFTVSLAPDSLLVDSSRLGKKPSRMVRQPLLVQLQTAPLVVYVTCSMAE